MSVDQTRKWSGGGRGVFDTEYFFYLAKILLNVIAAYHMRQVVWYFLLQHNRVVPVHILLQQEIKYSGLLLRVVASMSA